MSEKVCQVCQIEVGHLAETPVTRVLIDRDTNHTMSTKVCSVAVTTTRRIAVQ